MHISSHIHHQLNLVQNIQKEVILCAVMSLLVMLKNSGEWGVLRDNESTPSSPKRRLYQKNKVNADSIHNDYRKKHVLLVPNNTGNN